MWELRVALTNRVVAAFNIFKHTQVAYAVVVRTCVRALALPGF